MDAKDAARAMVDGCGLTHRQIEARAGRYTGWVAQSLARPRPGADLVAELARACGYSMQLVAMDGGSTISIGDHAGDDDGAPSLEQARAMISRGLAMLDGLDD